MTPTNWHVITGAPSSGKTTLINRLAQLGYHTSPEVARQCISEYLAKNHTLEDIHQDQLQANILSIMKDREQHLQPQELIFFDRGLPDSIAYFRYHHLDEKLTKNIPAHWYKKVFFCEGLPVIHDAIREEDDRSARKIGQYIYEAYSNLGYDLINLPPVSVDERLQIILSHLD